MRARFGPGCQLDRRNGLGGTRNGGANLTRSQVPDLSCLPGCDELEAAQGQERGQQRSRGRNHIDSNGWVTIAGDKEWSGGRKDRNNSEMNGQSEGSDGNLQNQISQGTEYSNVKDQSQSLRLLMHGVGGWKFE